VLLGREFMSKLRIYYEFVAKDKEMAGKAVVGDSLEEGSMKGPIMK